MSVAGVLPSATEEFILWEMPLARAFQYQVRYYGLHHGIQFRHAVTVEGQFDEAMKEIDALMGGKDE